MRICLALLPVLLLCGCASSGFRGTLNSSAVRPTVPESSVASLHIIRTQNAIGSIERRPVSLDGEFFLKIANGRHGTFKVDAGAHCVGMKYANPWVLMGWLFQSHQQLDAQFKAGEDYYFLVSPALKGFEIESLTKGEGREQMERTRALSFTRDCGEAIPYLSPQNVH
jgi:hypothetical protein